MNFNEWLKTRPEKLFGDQEHYAGLAWEACKKEMIKILKNTKAPKVPGMEGLGGCHWEDMDAETFREILIKEMKNL